MPRPAAGVEAQTPAGRDHTPDRLGTQGVVGLGHGSRSGTRGEATQPGGSFD